MRSALFVVLAVIWTLPGYSQDTTDAQPLEIGLQYAFAAFKGTPEVDMPVGVAASVGLDMGRIGVSLPVVYNIDQESTSDVKVTSTLAFAGIGLRWPARPGPYVSVAPGAQLSQVKFSAKNPGLPGGKVSETNFAAELSAGWLVPLNEAVAFKMSGTMRIVWFDGDTEPVYLGKFGLLLTPGK